MLSEEDLEGLGGGENIIKIYLNSKVVLNNRNIIRIKIKEHLLFLQMTQVWFKSPHVTLATMDSALPSGLQEHQHTCGTHSQHMHIRMSKINNLIIKILKYQEI